MPRLVVNQVLKGRRCSYQVIKSLTENVYQAKVEGTSALVAIKTAPDSPGLFLNEVNTYKYDCITASPYIRSLREYLDDNQCLVLEWMDNTLWETKGEITLAKAKVFKTVAKSCLEALAAFKDMDGNGQYVHADLNPNNILVSGFSSPTPVVKLADLGWTTRASSKNMGAVRIQGDAIRAPEIWKGAGPSPASDIWSLGVSLTHWLSSRIMFGVGGCNIKTNYPQEITNAGWCIAKLHKIRGADLEGPIKDDYITEWAIAENLLSKNLVSSSTVSEELEQSQTPLEYIAFIESLLTVDPNERPTVIEALAHPLLKD